MFFFFQWDAFINKSHTSKSSFMIYSLYNKHFFSYQQKQYLNQNAVQNTKSSPNVSISDNKISTDNKSLEEKQILISFFITFTQHENAEIRWAGLHASSLYSFQDHSAASLQVQFKCLQIQSQYTQSILCAINGSYLMFAPESDGKCSFSSPPEDLQDPVSLQK